MTVTKMGFQGRTLIGTAGGTAATLLTNIRDETIPIDTEKGPTTVRGDGSSPPTGTADVTGITWSCSWQMTMRTDDSELETLQVAAAAGTPVALRHEDYTSAKGFDGDVILSVSKGRPYKGEQTLDFSAEPTAQSGRDPQIYV